VYGLSPLYCFARFRKHFGSSPFASLSVSGPGSGTFGHACFGTPGIRRRGLATAGQSVCTGGGGGATTRFNHKTRKNGVNAIYPWRYFDESAYRSNWISPFINNDYYLKRCTIHIYGRARVCIVIRIIPFVNIVLYRSATLTLCPLRQASDGVCGLRSCSPKDLCGTR